MTRVGPRSRTPLKTMMFEKAAARIPEYATANASGRTSRSGWIAPGASSSATPTGIITIVPPIVAQVVRTSGV